MEGLQPIMNTIKSLDNAAEDLLRARDILTHLATEISDGVINPSYTMKIEKVTDEQIKALVLMMQQIDIVCEGGDDEITFKIKK